MTGKTILRKVYEDSPDATQASHRTENSSELENTALIKHVMGNANRMH
jgi:hypothetical protein